MTHKLLTTIISAALLPGTLYLGTTFTRAEAASTCDYHRGDLSAKLNWQAGKASVTNNTSSCTYKVGLASYQAHDAYPNPYPSCEFTECPQKHNWIWTQTYYDSNVINVAPGQTVKLSVS